MAPKNCFVLLFIAFVCILCVSDVCGQLSLDIVVEYPGGNLMKRKVSQNVDPEANFLSLRGDGLGLNWNSGVTLTQTSTNRWTYSLQYSSSNVGTQLQFKILVNDQTWDIGSNNIVTIPASSASVTVYPWFFTGAGKYYVATNGLWSPQLNNTRPIVVYVPPSYYENTFKWYSNILIMHDGQNVFNDSTSAFGVAWHADQTVNEYVNEGAMEEVLIVGVYNTVNRTNEYTYSYDPSEGAGGQGNLYLDYLEETVIPWVIGNFRVSIERSKLGILGSSLGGLISCYAGWTRPQTWSKIGCMSGSFWWNSEDFISTVMAQNPTPAATTFYVDVGTAEPATMLSSYLAVTEQMLKQGLVHNQTLYTYMMPGGHHSEQYWGERFWRPMEDLYPPVPVPTTPVADKANKKP